MEGGPGSSHRSLCSALLAPRVTATTVSLPAMLPLALPAKSGDLAAVFPFHQVLFPLPSPLPNSVAHSGVPPQVWKLFYPACTCAFSFPLCDDWQAILLVSFYLSPPPFPSGLLCFRVLPLSLLKILFSREKKLIFLPVLFLGWQGLLITIYSASDSIMTWGLEEKRPNWCPSQPFGGELMGLEGA